MKIKEILYDSKTKKQKIITRTLSKKEEAERLIIAQKDKDEHEEEQRRLLFVKEKQDADYKAWGEKQK